MRLFESSPSTIPDLPSLRPRDPPSTGCASAIERTSYARYVFTDSQAPELLLTVDQVPGSPFEMGFNYNDTNTDDAAQTCGPFLNDPLPDSRPQYEQPNFPPPPHDVRRDPVPYDQPGSLSTIVRAPGLSLHARFNEPPGLEGFNTVTGSSSGQMLGAGASLLAVQEQSPTTQEAFQTHKERLRPKMEKDRVRKHNQRSIDSQSYARICEVLNISLSPRNTLAYRSECLCVILAEDVECFVFRSPRSR